MGTQPTNHDRHTMTLIEIFEGTPSFQLNCPYEASDETRPCWPWHNGDDPPAERGEDDTPNVPYTKDEGTAVGCNYQPWFENIGNEVVYLREQPLTFELHAEWDDDAYVFNLGQQVIEEA